MKTEVNIEITPAMMAKQFWGMNNIEQCKFFKELADIIEEDKCTAEMQWYYLEQELRKDDKARSMLMDIAAPLFWQTLKYTGVVR